MRLKPVMKKIAAYSILILLLASPAISQGWGIIPEDRESKIDGLEKNYTIGMVNTDDRPVKLEFSAPESQNYDINFKQDTISLNSSYKTESPRGKSWFYAGQGQYFNVTYTGFTFKAAEERNANNIDFDVTVTSVNNMDPMLQNVPSSSLATERIIDYNIKIDKTLVKGLKQDEDIWNVDQDNNEESGQNIESKKEAESIIEENKPQNSSKNNRKNSDNTEKSVNKTTWALIGALILTVMYLFY